AAFVVLSLLTGLTAWAVDTATKPDAAGLTGGDWPQWRGPNRDGVCHETGLLTKWPEEGPPPLWQVEGLGKGYSSVAIHGGRIFTLGEIKGVGTVLMALAQKDGKPLWKTPVGGGSPNCTPTVDGNLVYGLGRDGDLVCCE